MYTQDMANLQEENSLLKTQISQLTENLERSREEISSIKDLNTQLFEQNNKMLDQIAILTKEISDLKQHVTHQNVNVKTVATKISLETPKIGKRSADQGEKRGEKRSKTIMDYLTKTSCAKNSVDRLTDRVMDVQIIGDEPNLTSIASNDVAVNANENENEIEATNQPIIRGDDDDVMNGTANNMNGGWKTVQFKKINKSKPIQKKRDSKANVTTSKPQPIHVQIGDEGYLALHNVLQGLLGSGKFITNHMKATQAARIHPADVETSNKIIQILTERGYEFHSFKAKDERSKCFILRGLNGVRNAEAIRVALIEAGFPENTGVIPHITGFQKSNPEIKHNTLYRVVTSNKLDEKILGEIDALFGLKIKFEKIKGKKVVQCKRCQGFFHSANGCHHAYKCVKCNEKHEIGQCARDINPELPIRCVNCDGAHTANNLNECKYFKENIMPILNKKKGGNNKNQKQKANPKASSSTENFVQPNITYAHATSSLGQQKPKTTTNANSKANNPTTKQTVSVIPTLTLEEKFDKYVEVQSTCQNQLVQLLTKLSRTMEAQWGNSSRW